MMDTECDKASSLPAPLLKRWSSPRVILSAVRGGTDGLNIKSPTTHDQTKSSITYGSVLS
jgi:hypothetical protein